jgi:cell wall-associated NlpC family hydrolase
MPRRTLRSVAAAASALSLLLAPLVARAEPTGAAVHVVEPGETLSQIADKLGVDPATLAKLNNLDDVNFLVAGQSLKLPLGSAAEAPVSGASAPAAPAAQVAPSPRAYVVVDGDTLWSIAQQFSTTTAALVDANNLDDPDHLHLGAKLVLPADAQPAPAAAVSAGAAAATASPAPQSPVAARPTSSAATTPAKRTLLVPYTVQAGETLTQIAKQFDVRSDAIAQASALDDPNRLSIGTVLKVPLPGHEHEVKAGETLRDIAAQEKVDLGSLIDFNSLDDPELIRVGQVVMVPTPPNLPPATATNTAAAPAQAAAATIAAAPASHASAPAASASAPAAPAAVSQSAGKTPKPAAPAAVVPPPRGAPTEGLAGAGLKLLGAPYVWGGSSPSGFDCSGFVWYAARQAGKSLSRGMLGEFNSGAHPARDELKPGDLVFFQNTYSAGLSHNGIYIGNNQFVHAADEAAGVTISSLATAYWLSHWFGATRLP